MSPRRIWGGLALIAFFLAGCTPTIHAEFVTPLPTTVINVVSMITPATAPALIIFPDPTLTPIATAGPAEGLPAAPTAQPTRTPEPPTPVPTLRPVPTATPLLPCSQRVPQDDLLIFVSKTYALSRDYEPQDLISLNQYLGPDVTLGYPTAVRAVVLAPLLQMVADMQAGGLAPTIISGYRSYEAQSLAWSKWNEEYPEWADRISMRPGHSEHQLGTTIDFGSPELGEIVGDQSIEFHTFFDRTSEGRWLAENAVNYGFTMSYPPNSADYTEFNYEPWHYRYVGVDMARALAAEGIPLLEHQRRNGPAPCIPDTIP